MPCSSSGSSPRVRGTGIVVTLAVRSHRFIPARAGNRRDQTASQWGKTVHPRACGEQAIRPGPADTFFGSSPRVRGTVQAVVGAGCDERFIPARAGNSCDGRNWPGRSPVHPRACGEQVSFLQVERYNDGSSPRVRGTAGIDTSGLLGLRFIPARAGNRGTGDEQPLSAAVHPRACGEQDMATAAFCRLTGSSPRVRGTVLAADPVRHAGRFIPARAGNRL